MGAVALEKCHDQSMHRAQIDIYVAQKCDDMNGELSLNCMVLESGMLLMLSVTLKTQMPEFGPMAIGATRQLVAQSTQWYLFAHAIPSHVCRCSNSFEMRQRVFCMQKMSENGQYKEEINHQKTSQD